jgi:FlaA1/EpsC-like NDP-sugar epimerase
MIADAGLKPYEDIDIQFIGLRPGEKLYEELWSNEETPVPTEHDKILIVKAQSFVYATIKKQLDELVQLSENSDNVMIVKKMKQIVPEFISANSPYSALD